MSNTQKNIVITWATSKNADGSFTGTCYAFFTKAEAFEGRHISKQSTLFSATCATREMAKSRAVKAKRYYSNPNNNAELLEKMQAQFPPCHVSDNAAKPA